MKLDTQGLLDDLKNPGDRRELIPAYQNAVHESLASHFEDRVISCMSQYPSNIFSPQILLSSSTSLSRRISMRNSDDFWPNDPSSDPWYVFPFSLIWSFTKNKHLNSQAYPLEFPYLAPDRSSRKYHPRLGHVPNRIPPALFPADGLPYLPCCRALPFGRSHIHHRHTITPQHNCPLQYAVHCLLPLLQFSLSSHSPR